MRHHRHLGHPRALVALAAAAGWLLVPAAAESSRIAAQQSADAHIVVQPRPGTSARAVDELVDELGARSVRRIPALGARVVRVPRANAAAALAALERSRVVEYAERDSETVRIVWTMPASEQPLEPAELRPNDSSWPAQWSLLKTNAPAAWASTTGSPATVVAVIDTGVDFAQPDLQGAFVAGYDFVNGDADPTDDLGHGTMVAGIVAARSNNGVGIAGTCWRCSIMPVKVIGADGSGTNSAVAAGITWAVDHGARVLNLSLGSSTHSAVLADAVAYAQQRGAVVVAGAGNTGGTAPFYPAAYPGVVSVAGTNGDDRLYAWSTRGPWVAVAAPGCNETTIPNGSYGLFCGTSSAAPVVAGLAGLARSFAPETGAGEIVQAIQAGALAIGDTVRFGRVDAAKTLATLGARPARAGKRR